MFTGKGNAGLPQLVYICKYKTKSGQRVARFVAITTFTFNLVYTLL